MRIARFLLLAAGLAFSSSGCNTPDAIADFAASSDQALASSVPIFQDLGGSCLRVKNLEKEVGSFEVVSSDPGCTAIAKEADASVAAVQILAEYFGALHALAKYGVTRTASDANDLAAKAAGLTGASTDAQTAIGSIAKFLTTAATSAYQMKSLQKDVTRVNTNVAAVTTALIQILQENYVHQGLGSEEEKLSTHYKEYSRAHPEGTTAVLLDERWHTDHRRLEARQAAAANAIVALGEMRDGMAALAANAGSLKAKEIPGLLDPYITQLQDLIPQIQKAF